MKFAFKSLCLIAVICLLAGCDSHNCAVWSPDGNKLGVIENYQFKLSSENGDLSQSLIDKMIDFFCWFSNSNNVAVVSQEFFTNWDSLKPNLSDQQIRVVIKAAAPLKEALAKRKDSLENIWEDFPSLNNESKQNCALLYLKQRYGNKLIVANSESRKAMDQMGVSIQYIETYSLDPSVKQIQTLYHTTHDITSLNISPDDKKIAFIEDHRLFIESTDGGLPVFVCSNCSDISDWLPNSKTIIFCCCDKDNASDSAYNSNLNLGVIEQVTVCDKNDHLLDKISNSQLLVWIAFSKDIGIRCCKDNSILFSAPETQLPATPVEVDDGARLFKISPGSIPTAIRISPRRLDFDLGSRPCAFISSPDGHYAAVPGAMGQIAILDLRTGEGQTLNNEDYGSPNSLYLMPQWRNNDQFTFVTHLGGKLETKHPADLVLWSVSKESGKVLSKDWPEETIKNLFE